VTTLTSTSNKLTSTSNNIDFFSQLYKSWSWQSLCQDIGKLHICTDVGDVNDSFLLQSSDEMKLHVDMLCALMKFRILD
jgi:hypothetical protein